MRVTQAQYAKLAGISRQRVHRLVGKGFIVLDESGKVDVEQADAARGVAGAGNAAPAPAVPDGLPDIGTSRRVEAAFRARRMKVEAQAREGRYVEIDKVRDSLQGWATVVRQSVLAVPDRLAQDLAGVSSAREIRRLMMDALRDALDVGAEGIARSV